MPSSISLWSPEESKTAPELSVSSWLNTNKPMSLLKLRGKVILLEAFQMLCPACVFRSLPQASVFAELFRGEDFQLIGLHSVFEHHDVMTKEALEVFIHEYNLKFPIAIDKPSSGEAIPQTMKAYNMGGTPTTILIDKSGKIRASYLGQVREEQITAQIGYLLAE